MLLAVKTHVAAPPTRQCGPALAAVPVTRCKYRILEHQNLLNLTAQLGCRLYVNSALKCNLTARKFCTEMWLHSSMHRTAKKPHFQNSSSVLAHARALPNTAPLASPLFNELPSIKTNFQASLSSNYQLCYTCVVCVLRRIVWTRRPCSLQLLASVYALLL